MKFKYVGGSKMQVSGQTVSNGDIVELPDNFRHLNFEPIFEKKSRQDFNDIKIKPKKRRKKK